MRILVVDDQAVNRGMLSFLLDEDGHEVVEAASGSEAVDRYQEIDPDLVLLDVVMPEMDGYETAQCLKSKADRYVPIIFLTALNDDASLSRCIESGGDDFLTKPVNETLLTAKIKAHERIRELNNELTRKNAELEQYQGLIRQEHDLAEYVFNSALSFQQECGNVKRFISPMSGFSGDLILTAYTRRNTLFIMLGDFTGHGLPAALGALPISQVFQTLADQGASIRELAVQLNKTLYDYLPGHMFCAANLMELNQAGNTVTCWLGGLPDMLLVDEQGYIKEPLKSRHLPLGVLSNEQFRSDLRQIRLGVGERLVTYSDGVTDCCDRDGEMLGETRFEQMFDGHVGGDELFDDLVNRIRTFGEGRPQDDDISILEVSGKPFGVAFEELDRALHLDWELRTELDPLDVEEPDVVTRLLNLFANRSQIRLHEERAYKVVSALYHYVVDRFFLGLPSPFDSGKPLHHQQMREQRLAELEREEERHIYAKVNYCAEEISLTVALSDRPVNNTSGQTPLGCTPFRTEIVKSVYLTDDGHCISVEFSL